MLWGVIVLTYLLGTLLIVVIFAIFKYKQLGRIQNAVRYAWENDGVCKGRDDDAECKLTIVDDLEQLPIMINSEFSHTVARTLADYVTRTELNKDIVTPRNHKLVAEYKPSTGSTFGVAWIDERTGIMVLAFRATETHTEIQDDLSAWQVNFDTGEKVDRAQPDHGSGVDIDGPNAHVHSGFYKVMQNYLDDIYNTIGEHKPSVIYICGHSLGGAMATLLTVSLGESVDRKSDVRVESVEQIGSYVFGTPRTGNENFNKRLEGITSRKAFWRVVNKADMIQTLPLHVTPNLKFPTQEVFYYVHAGPEHSYFFNWGGWRVNHFLPNYTSYLDNFLEP